MPSITIIYPENKAFFGSFEQGELKLKDWQEVSGNIQTQMEEYKKTCYQKKDEGSAVAVKVKSDIQATFTGTSGKGGLVNLYKFQAAFQCAKTQDSLSFISLVIDLKQNNTKNSGNFPTLLFRCALSTLAKTVDIPKGDTQQERLQIITLFNDNIERYISPIFAIKPEIKNTDDETVYDCTNGKLSTNPLENMKYIALSFDYKNLNLIYNRDKANLLESIEGYKKTCKNKDGAIRNNFSATFYKLPGQEGYDRAIHVEAAIKARIKNGLGLIILTKKTGGNVLHTILRDFVLDMFPDFKNMMHSEEIKENFYQGILKAVDLMLFFMGSKEEEHLIDQYVAVHQKRDQHRIMAQQFQKITNVVGPLDIKQGMTNQELADELEQKVGEFKQQELKK